MGPNLLRTSQNIAAFEWLNRFPKQPQRQNEAFSSVFLGRENVDLNDWIPELDLASQLIIGLIATFVLYFGFKKTAELGKHAAQNTAASILVALANIVLVTVFLEDLNGFAQTAYNFLGIPTLDPKTWDAVPFLIVCLIGIATKDLADYANHRLMHTRLGMADPCGAPFRHPCERIQRLSGAFFRSGADVFQLHRAFDLAADAEGIADCPGPALAAWHVCAHGSEF